MRLYNINFTNRVDVVSGVKLVRLYLVRQQLSDTVQCQRSNSENVQPFVLVDHAEIKIHHLLYTALCERWDRDQFEIY